ncbi:indolepyruvate ferredoxin oxidoreductase subunit alpha [bacterium]|nr:indolepyruvate ferredoxin oxidoreductase subunit alpha [bacterium]
MKKILSGNEAIARGAWEAAADLATGYPGTPSTEILETVARSAEGIQCQWSVNEKVALEVAAGASWAGGRVMVTMKHVGLNVAADPLFTLAYTGVRGGLVIVNADDPQQFSSQNEQDNRHYARSAKSPMLEPADSQEAKDFTRAAFDLSEGFDTPVILRTTTRISHSKTLVSLGERVERLLEPAVRKEPPKLVMVPEFGRRRHVELEKRILRLKEYAEETPLNVLLPGRGDSLGIITSGAAFQYAREVFPGAGFLKLGLVYPLPKKLITDFASRYRKVIVVEELDPFLEEQIRSWGIEVEGSEKRALTGELTPDLVKAAWGKAGGRKRPAAVTGIPARPPVLCPGCPHRGIFSVLKRKGVFVAGDIGCYTLAAIPPLAALDSCLCMGASFGTAFGMERILPPSKKRKVAAVIGDSTFFHSGITPLADIVYNRGETLCIVLDNRTTAMTGRQEHPGSGRTLGGEEVPRMSVAAIGKAMGVKNVAQVNAYDYRAVERVLDRMLKARGPGLLVNNGACVLLERKPMAPPFVVDKGLCDGCRRCLMIACPSLSLEGKRKKAKVLIDPLTCYGCNLCAEVCTRGAIGCGGKS